MASSVGPSPGLGRNFCNSGRVSDIAAKPRKNPGAEAHPRRADKTSGALTGQSAFVVLEVRSVHAVQ